MAIAEEVRSGQVTEVRGADSLVVAYDGSSHAFRLEGLGVVRGRPALAVRAEEILRERLVGKTVRLSIRGYVEGGVVPVGAVLVEGKDVRVALVRRGLVAYCPRHAVEVSLQGAEREARAAKRGLWADPPSPTSDPCRGAV